ncbi:MAG: nicotinate-nucleotide--dimethylbenzimidazole phosphoribosyltransferase [Desulfovibrionaceae bacterium]|nr:nicotinate-nucleotide--dimethylbenzimidazole phosphoribosyltransferase [Desulfovibrionaceae bacterium]
MENALQNLINSVTPPDAGMISEGQAHLDSLTKPVGSLGRLEEIALQLWRIQGARPLCCDPALIYTAAADHGLTEEKIGIYPPEVTRQMVENFLNGGAAINAMCSALNLEQIIIDAGCFGPSFPPHPRLLEMRAGCGTANFCKGAAMTARQCLTCISNGISLARRAAKQQIRCIGLGEMGIGNSTAAAALFCAYLNLKPEEVCGPGAGLPPGGLTHKTAALHQALQINRAALQTEDPLQILTALGGFEIATLTGIILGAAREKILLVVDGFISTAAYAAAWKLCPPISDYCIFSHTSQEKGHNLVLSRLGRRPLLDLGMRLGEGTGAALAIALIRSAAAVFNRMATFDAAGISKAKGGKYE